MRALPTIIAAFIFGTLSGIALWLLRLCGLHGLRKRVQVACNIVMTRIWRMKIVVSGELAQAPVMLMANHCSYLDVFILGSLRPVRFTPKSDVKKWPLIGQVVQSFDVIFVDRTPGKAKQAQHDLLQALSCGDTICVFPEGTTNNGRTLKPFKPTLFSLAEQWEGEEKLQVQPVVVRYTSLNGQPMDDGAWDKIAWYGEADLMSHLWAYCKVRQVEVTIECLPPLELGEGEDRKSLATRARADILASLPHIKEST